MSRPPVMILNEDDDRKSLNNVSHAEINAVNEMEKCTWIQTKWCALLLTRYYSGEACFTIRGGGREYFLMLETTNHLQSGRTCSGKWERKYSFKHGKMLLITKITLSQLHRAKIKQSITIVSILLRYPPHLNLPAPAISNKKERGN